MRQIMLILIILYLLSNFSITQTNLWEQTNGPLGGNMDCLVMNNSGQLFVGGEGGIFRYTNENGWVQTYATQNSIEAMTSNQNGQIFAGTWRHGFYRSLDFGEIWERIWGNIGNEYITSVDINYNGDIFVSTLQGGIYHSNDLGDSWTVINSGLSTNNIRAVAFNTDGQAFAATNSGVFKSTNNGNSWIAINEGLTNLDIRDIAVSSTGDIFVITYYSAFLSTDKGISWTQVLNDKFGNWVIQLNSNDDIFIGTENIIFRSTDHGVTWSNYVQGLPSKKITDLSVDKNGRLYAVVRGKIYYSETNGSSWISKNEGLKAITVRKMLWSKNNYLIVIDNNGIYRSKDRGNNWVQTSNEGRSCIAQYPRNGNIFVNGYPGLYKSTDDGQTWTELRIGQFVDSTSVSSIAINSLGHIFCLTYRYGFIRSTDNGLTWSTFDNDFKNINTNSIIIDSKDNIFVSTYQQGVFRSVDNGESWSQVNNGFNSLDARHFAFNGEDKLLVAMYNGDIYSSDNLGDSWEQLGNRMWNYVSDLIILKDGDIFASSEGYGVFRFNKNNGYWDKFDEGFGFGYQAGVESLSSDPSGYLYAGVIGNSVFRTINPIISSIEEKTDMSLSFFLSRNYPNPFNPTTKIDYELSRTSLVTLKVYDLLGREVNTLVHEQKPAGNYEVTFNASDLPSGIYFYQLRAGTFSQTKKLIVLK